MNATSHIAAFFACFLCLLSSSTRAAGDPVGLISAWKRNGLASPVFEINGTEGRNNPLRKALKKPFSGDELFVRYRIRYSADSIDLPAEDEGEFFVLWLDTEEGNDRSTHSGGVPNVGIHVSGEQNRFMVRYSSGGEKFGAELKGDRDFLVVARLWKSNPGPDQPFDQFSLWIDPKAETEFKPDTSASSKKSISVVKWIGFSTGGKTEMEDRIFVWDVDVATDWRTILKLPPESEAEKAKKITAAPRQRTIDFDKHVFPILDAKCFQCHAGEDAKKDIRLDIQDEMLNASHLVLELISNREMPPEGEPQLTDREIATLKTWIGEGIAWNEKRLPPARPKTNHWAFQPIVRPDVPETTRSDWVQTPVDAFIARKQEQLGTEPAPEADSATLTRRMSLDLLGLPPEGSQSAESVDALLSDPAYGERWGRHWLDVARWAESNGHQHNRPRPHAWRYRDWVVDAFNSDMPFDQFLRAQLAGDEIAPDDENHLIATGFLAAARYSGNELDKDIQRNDILVDIVNTTGSAFLGLTFECAQCHTHKFDPISLRDYYRMQAFFATGEPGNVSLAMRDEASAGLVKEHWEIFDRTYERQVFVRRRQGQPNAALVLPKTVKARMTAPDKKRFQEIEAQISKLDQAWAFSSPDSGCLPTPHEMRWPLPRDPDGLKNRKTHILLRGDVKAPGPEVKPGWPLVFGETPQFEENPRTALADWMTDPKNPLTARVWVNRVWQWHFGKGLVETSGDFGAQGTEPTHPELLDFLASELIENDWSTRHIHRLILESATYRQSSQFNETNAARDPENNTYWRWIPRRLEAEAIRDAMLAVSGRLDRKSGGPSDAIKSGSRRRALYLKQERERFPHQQMLFDSANGLASCARRRVSTNALQPLWLLNSKFSQETSAALAERAGSVQRAFELCLNRHPNASELELLNSQVEKHGLESACLAILNASEFLYLP